MDNTAQQQADLTLQEKLDIVMENIEKSDKYLDFCYLLSLLNDRQFRALYCFVKYAPADEITDDKQFTEDIGDNYKYSAKFF